METGKDLFVVFDGDWVHPRLQVQVLVPVRGPGLEAVSVTEVSHSACAPGYGSGLKGAGSERVIATAIGVATATAIARTGAEVWMAFVAARAMGRLS